MGTLRLTLLSLLAIGTAACSISTSAFTDGRGHVVPGSVATMTDELIGGIPQRLWFRGVSASAPVLVLLHGGPGASESALFRRFNAELERHFLVVYWDQRGAGRSFTPAVSPESMTIARFVADLDDVVELVRHRFQTERVVLLGHSWGSAIGLLYVARHPRKVAAYLGVGQVVDMPRGERESWAFARHEAERRRHRDALETLNRIGPPPHTVDEMLTSRRWVERFGGTFHEHRSTLGLIWAALRTDEANLVDLVRFGRGNRFSLDQLWGEFRTLDLDTTCSFEVPIAFLLGRHDWVVPSVLAADYFTRITAPRKRLVWFERSAHNVPFEEPGRFNRVVVETVNVLTLGAAAPGDRR